MTRLAGQRVLVTGTAGGIGAAIRDRFVAQGAAVTGLDRADPTAACDIADEAAVDAFVGRQGPFDALVHAAALTGATGPFPDVATADFRRYVEVNLIGAFFVTRAVVRGMREHRIAGRIVLVGSVDSLAAEPDAAPYVAAKHGLLGLSRSVAVDCAGIGITCNLIAPGPITVPRNRELFESEPTLSGFAAAVPLGGPGTPDAIATAALYLCDPAAAYVTGTVLTVDGGLGARLRFA